MDGKHKLLSENDLCQVLHSRRDPASSGASHRRGVSLRWLLVGNLRVRQKHLFCIMLDYVSSPSTFENGSRRHRLNSTELPDIILDVMSGA